MDPAGTGRRTGRGPLRVFLSHTSDLREFPRDGSFVAAAEAAVIRAGHAVTDMAYFAARDSTPMDTCIAKVAECQRSRKTVLAHFWWSGSGVVRFPTIAPVCDTILLDVLFPHLTGVRIEELSDDNGVVRIHARAHSDEATCPVCGNQSARVHAWYERKLADAPVAGRQVMIRLHVRKFLCQTLGCARQIFVEQLAGLTVRYGRRSLQLLGLLTAITFALAGRAGARLARQAAIMVSPTTLIRLLRAAPEPESATPTVLGVDDFALRRGHDYGTVLIDMGAAPLQGH